MIDSLVIRQEREGDSDEIRCVVKAAFDGAEHTDGDEHNLVDRLRDSAEYIPALSLVAEIDNEIVGYAMFSRIFIGETEAIALAPLAVLPEFQNRGIGRARRKEGHRRTMDSKYPCSVILGYPEYYSKSGYIPAASFGITAPFDVPSQFYMVFPFKAGVPHGTVRYSRAFRL